MATIEVLRETDEFGRHFHKGDTFQAGNDRGEGACRLVFKKEQTRDVENFDYKDGAPQSNISDCPWLHGFADRESDAFRIKVPGGPQHWYHLVDKQGNAMGWYLTHQDISEFDPIMKHLEMH